MGKLLKTGALVLCALLAAGLLAGCDDGGSGGSSGPAAGKVRITWNADGGAVNPAYTDIDTGATVATLPEPTKSNNSFKGWFTEKNGGGTQFTTATTVPASITVYAKWTVIDPNAPPETPEFSAQLAGANYDLNQTTGVLTLRVAVTGASGTGNAIAGDGGALTYQWWSATSADGDGAAINNQTTRDLMPSTTTAGSTWYWCVVTNTKNSQTANASTNKARINVTAPSGDTAIERIISNNSSVPLWEFVLPAGATWADYVNFTVDYYVSKDSMVTVDQVRSRAYGAYLPTDLVSVDPGNGNNWGSYQLLNFNAATFRGQTGGGGGAENSTHPNNDFIIDNSKGNNADFSALFAAYNGGTSKWFTVTYKIDGTGSPHGNAVTKNICFPKLPIYDEEDVLYLGAGIIQDGGHANTDYEFYVKNPILIHKEDPTLNIVGSMFVTGTTAKLFAGNLGSVKGGTDREVVTAGSFEDVEGEITITFDLVGGKIGDSYDPVKVKIMQGETVPESQWPVAPTRNDFTFKGWFVDTDEVDTTTEFTEKTTVKAVWESNITVMPFNVDLSGQPAADYKYTGNYQGDPLIDFGETFNADLYKDIVITFKLYEDDTGAKGDFWKPVSGNLTLKFFQASATNANSGNVGQSYNVGTDTNGLGSTYDESNGTVTDKRAIPASAQGAAAFTKIALQKGSGDFTYIEVISIVATPAD